MRKYSILLLIVSFLSIKVEAQNMNKRIQFKWLKIWVQTAGAREAGNAYKSIELDTANCELYQFFTDGYYSVDSLQNLDTTKISWDIFNPNPDTTTQFHKLLRITIAAKEGKLARKCFNSKNEPDLERDKKIFRLLFDYEFIGMDTKFKMMIERYMKNLIGLCNGLQPDKDLGNIIIIRQ